MIWKCEICKTENWQEDHHIVSKSKGGSNKRHNIARLCGTDHNKIHSGELVIEGKFLTTEGHKLIWRRKDEESITGFPPPDVWIR